MYNPKFIRWIHCDKCNKIFLIDKKTHICFGK